jgi:hypothetical protein
VDLARELSLLHYYIYLRHVGSSATNTIVSCRLLQQPAIIHSTRKLPQFSKPPRRTIISVVSGSINLMTSTSSHVCSLTSRVHGMAIQSMTCFRSEIYSPGRCCCSTIMLLLWTRRYDVCALVLPSTTLDMIRSSGYGRSSIAFNESGLALINFQRLRWRLPRIAFFLNRYVICPLILCVTCKTCA